MDVIYPRGIRSYSRREGRMSERQSHALKIYWEHYGLDPEKTLSSLDAIFPQAAPCIFEIGFGMGTALIAMAESMPHLNFIGAEVHKPGVGGVLAHCVEKNITNLRVYHADAVQILQRCIPDHSLHAIHIFFPDPWQKTRHFKRRLIQAPFVALLARKLVKQGNVHLATDWEEYAHQMLQVFTASDHWINPHGKNNFATRPDFRPLTKYEKRGIQYGRNVWDLIFINQ